MIDGSHILINWSIALLSWVASAGFRWAQFVNSWLHHENLEEPSWWAYLLGGSQMRVWDSGSSCFRPNCGSFKMDPQQCLACRVFDRGLNEKNCFWSGKIIWSGRVFKPLVGLSPKYNRLAQIEMVRPLTLLKILTIYFLVLFFKKTNSDYFLFLIEWGKGLQGIPILFLEVKVCVGIGFQGSHFPPQINKLNIIPSNCN